MSTAPTTQTTESPADRAIRKVRENYTRLVAEDRAKREYARLRARSLDEIAAELALTLKRPPSPQEVMDERLSFTWGPARSYEDWKGPTLS